jgi:hypothetical protein
VESWLDYTANKSAFRLYYYQAASLHPIPAQYRYKIISDLLGYIITVTQASISTTFEFATHSELTYPPAGILKPLLSARAFHRSSTHVL